MTSLYIALGLVGLLGFSIWLATMRAREAGRAEAEAETNKRMADNAEAQGRVMAEHREPGDVSRRLGDGTF